ncbi:cytoplasmic phosphatidylinositol transfer protein 1-like [Ptychodera flava]|uniref:cytoplasmic phosphatidylinositol transfer protein 1-like n=1 Tax=Ptychodera flava TaxID=63121 RepID=UPI00396A6F26
MLMKEYRVCMPLSVEEYNIGQLYMIAKHSNEQSEKGEGVEVVRNEPHEDPVHGKGQYTEKRIHLSNRLPSWVRAVIPNIFYITEKAWNYYPFTKTEYTCSFLPRFTIEIETKYENNSGTTVNVHNLTQEELINREVIDIDIAYDELPEKYFKEKEDLKKFKSVKTGRGPLEKGWRETSDPIMCSYKLVKVKFEVWGFQTKVESYTHAAIRDILLLGHRQAFAWIDEWIDMTKEDVRNYEKKLQEETNQKVGSGGAADQSQAKPLDEETLRQAEASAATPATPT